MTEVDIANLALAHLGAAPIRALTDQTSHAKLMSTYLPVARDQVLRSHEWRTAMKRSRLVDIFWKADTSFTLGDIIMVDGAYFVCTQSGTSGSTIPASWPKTGAISDNTVQWAWTSTNRTLYSYQYAIPSDCLRVIEVGDEAEWILEGTTLYTDDAPDTVEGNPIVRYTKSLASPSDWDANLCDLVALKLAIIAAPSVMGSSKDVALLSSLYMQAFRLAKIASAGGGSSPEPEPTRWTDL